MRTGYCCFRHDYKFIIVLQCKLFRWDVLNVCLFMNVSDIFLFFFFGFRSDGSGVKLQSKNVQMLLPYFVVCFDFFVFIKLFYKLKPKFIYLSILLSCFVSFSLKKKKPFVVDMMLHMLFMPDYITHYRKIINKPFVCLFVYLTN